MKRKQRAVCAIMLTFAMTGCKPHPRPAHGRTALSTAARPCPRFTLTGAMATFGFRRANDVTLVGAEPSTFAKEAASAPRLKSSYGWLW